MLIMFGVKSRVIKSSIWILYLLSLAGMLLILYRVNSFGEITILAIFGVIGGIYWTFFVRSFNGKIANKWLRYIIWLFALLISVLLSVPHTSNSSSTIDTLSDVFFLESFWAFATVFRQFIRMQEANSLLE